MKRNPLFVITSMHRSYSRLLAAFLLCLSIAATAQGGDLLAITWKKIKTDHWGPQFCSNEIFPVGSTCKVRVVESHGKSNRIYICGHINGGFTPGSVHTVKLEDNIGGDHDMRLRVGVGTLFAFEEPISSTKQENGVWLLKFSNCSVEVKLYGESF